MAFTGSVVHTGKKVAFHTLGCKLNFSETSSIARMFQQQGFVRAELNQLPDIVVINTCSVTDNADKKCRQAVQEALRNGNEPYVIVIGCYAQLKPDEIASIPGVDAVLGANEKFRLLELLDSFEKHRQPKVFAGDIADVTAFNSAYSINDRTRTFLKIQDGCDYSCSFCTIPLARGKSRSDTVENVIFAAREIVSRGVKEIVLTGVNTGDFGIRNGQRQDKFIDVLLALEQLEGIERIRVSSIEPNLLTDEIIELVSRSRVFARHFHIPLQSGSDKILKLMRRRYLSELYKERVEKIKREIPGCCIGVDVIVGFPDEREEDFLETFNFLRDLDVSYLHVFTYSERPNTLAAVSGNAVTMEVRKERSAMLRSLSDKKRRHFYGHFAGTLSEVLFENDLEGGKIHGFTDNYIRVAVKHDPGIVNTIQQVRLNDISPACVMQGTLVNEPYLVS